MPGHLIITRGLPGSGKTTAAEKWRAEEPATRARVNRDDMRDMLWGGWTGDRRHEEQVTAITAAAVRRLLEHGWAVIADDTNLRSEYVERQCELALAVGATYEVWDFLVVPVEVCIARDAARGEAGGRLVGADVIRRMHRDYLAQYAPPLRVPG